MQHRGNKITLYFLIFREDKKIGPNEAEIFCIESYFIAYLRLLYKFILFNFT